MTADPKEANRQRSWPDYRAIWRWHFYAGLVCIPFVIWLSITGAIYLFRPQIEAAIDAPFNHLEMDGAVQPASVQTAGALEAVPGTELRSYQIPADRHAATQILVGEGARMMRVYVHPETLAVLKIVDEDDRFMRQIFHLHGELLMGDRGSMIVELAACWAIVMIVTGLVLWWPRGAGGLAGVLYPRRGGRMFWRDLHAVTGFWVSGLALFLIVTGLPWAKNWGGYLREVRERAGWVDARPQDWTIGRSGELAARMAAAESDESAHAGHTAQTAAAGADLAALDRVLATVRQEDLAQPVLISPPRQGESDWSAKSDAANRTLRAELRIDGETGALIARTSFAGRHPLDRAIGIGISAHEGALFGPLNQIVSALAALGLVVLSVSAAVLWLRRRPPNALGAPERIAAPRFSWALLAAILLFGILFPLLGLSLIAVLGVERLVLRRIPGARRWLGLSAP